MMRGRIGVDDTGKQKLAKVVNGELMGRAAKQAIDAIQTAVLVAAIMPAICSPCATRSGRRAGMETH